MRDFRFLTLEEEPLSAASMEGLKAVWIFWPTTLEPHPNHVEIDAFRRRLNRLLDVRGDLAVLEFHHQHKSAQTAPRRDQQRHEHLWDPQSVTALRIGLERFPTAVIVDPELKLAHEVQEQSADLDAFYLGIVGALARVDARSTSER